MGILSYDNVNWLEKAIQADEKAYKEGIILVDFEYTITDEQGIHARPAGEFVKLVKNYESEVLMEKNGQSADCRKLFALMSLGVKKGDTIKLHINGTDEEKAFKAVESFIKENL